MPQETVDRSTGIGASEVAAVVGENPYKTVLKVYLAHTTPQAKTEPNESQSIGLDCEPMLLAWAGRRLRHPVLPNKRTFRHPKLDFAIATPDGFEVDDDTWARQALVEAKTAKIQSPYSAAEEHALDFWGEEWTDEIPRCYIIQAEWQMLVMELPRCYLPAMVGGLGRRIYQVERNEALIKVLIEKVGAFWECVLAKKPPEPNVNDDPEQTEDALTAIWRQRHDDLLPSTPDLDTAARLTCELEFRAKFWDGQYKQARNHWRQVIADAYGVQGDWGKIIWPQARETGHLNKDALVAELIKRLGLGTKEVEELTAQFTTPKSGGRTLRAYWKKALKETVQKEITDASEQQGAIAGSDGEAEGADAQ